MPKSIRLAQMNWCEREEHICAGTDQQKVKALALRLLKDEHGTGTVNRGQAMCSAKFSSSEIEIVTIPYID